MKAKLTLLASLPAMGVVLAGETVGGNVGLVLGAACVVGGWGFALRTAREWSSSEQGFLSELERARTEVADAEQRGDRLDVLLESLRKGTHDRAQQLLDMMHEQEKELQQSISSMGGVYSQVDGLRESAVEMRGSLDESGTAISELAASASHLSQNAIEMSDRVHNASSAIEQAASSVTAISESTNSLSEVASQTSTTIESMAASLKRVDEHADHSASLSAKVVETADAGRIKVRKTIEGIERIHQSAEFANETIGVLGTRVDEIGTIVGVIDQVADDTSLLALNAAIIAAQAGDHGAGFSVVANEISELAGRVSASTKEIALVIGSVQEESRKAVAAMKEGLRDAGAGVELSVGAGEALDEITQAARESGDRIEGIVRGVSEQTEAAEAVVVAFDSVRRLVEQIQSALQEQSTGNRSLVEYAESLSGIAVQLQATAGEQASTTTQMRTGSTGILETASQMEESLKEQVERCSESVASMRSIHKRVRAALDSLQELNVELDAPTSETSSPIVSRNLEANDSAGGVC